MASSGWAVYVLAAALGVMFWRHGLLQGLDRRLAAADEEHFHVHRVLHKHPHGGSWSEFKRWMNEEA